MGEEWINGQELVQNIKIGYCIINTRLVYNDSDYNIRYVQADL